MSQRKKFIILVLIILVMSCLASWVLSDGSFSIETSPFSLFFIFSFAFAGGIGFYTGMRKNAELKRQGQHIIAWYKQTMLTRCLALLLTGFPLVYPFFEHFLEHFMPSYGINVSIGIIIGSCIPFLFFLILTFVNVIRDQKRSNSRGVLLK